MSLTSNLQAQTLRSNSVVTKVGNPSGPKPVTGDLASVVYWAGQIVPKLQLACEGYYNRLPTLVTNGTYTVSDYQATDCSNPGNRFWCTDLVISAYNLGGITGGVNQNHRGVAEMNNFWQSAQAASLGYTYINYQAVKSVADVKPGFVMFYAQHVRLVKEVKFNDIYGNGVIIAYESNGPSPEFPYPFHNFQLDNPNVLAFGGHQ